MDVQTIRAAAWEMLHAHEEMSATAIADATGAATREVVVALGTDPERFDRVAGEGCWWWRMHPLAGYGHKKQRPDEAARDDGTTARAWRQRLAIRERVRGALQANPGGATLKRLVLDSGLAGAEVADQLQGLRALGEVVSFTIPGMAGFEFWKESAA